MEEEQVLLMVVGKTMVVEVEVGAEVVEEAAAVVVVRQLEVVLGRYVRLLEAVLGR